MPLYEYKCEKCDIVLERIVSFQEREEIFRCPKCNQPTERQLSLPSPPVFNGTGFTPKFHSK